MGPPFDEPIIGVYYIFRPYKSPSGEIVLYREITDEPGVIAALENSRSIYSCRGTKLLKDIKCCILDSTAGPSLSDESFLLGVTLASGKTVSVQCFLEDKRLNKLFMIQGNPKFVLSERDAMNLHRALAKGP
jgi:hypothetical protein